MAAEVTDWLSAVGAIFSAVAALAAWRAVVEANRISRIAHENAAKEALDTLLERFDAEASSLRSRLALALEVVHDLENAVRVKASKQGALGFVEKQLGDVGIDGFRETVKIASDYLDEQIRIVDKDCTPSAIKPALRQVIRCAAPIDSVIERAKEVREQYSR